MKTALFASHEPTPMSQEMRSKVSGKKASGPGVKRMTVKCDSLSDEMGRKRF